MVTTSSYPFEDNEVLKFSFFGLISVFSKLIFLLVLLSVFNVRGFFVFMLMIKGLGLKT